MHLVILSRSPSSKTRTHCTLHTAYGSSLALIWAVSHRQAKSKGREEQGEPGWDCKESNHNFSLFIPLAIDFCQLNTFRRNSFLKAVNKQHLTTGPDKPSSPLPRTSRAGTNATLTTGTYLSPGLELRGFFTCAYSVSIRCPSLGLWGLALRARQPS